jgi:formylmethanofuran dehydrogenase subunit E
MASEDLAQEATCASCGDVVYVPADEDPEDTLCVACAEDEQEEEWE